MLETQICRDGFPMQSDHDSRVDFNFLVHYAGLRVGMIVERRAGGVFLPRRHFRRVAIQDMHSTAHALILG